MGKIFRFFNKSIFLAESGFSWDTLYRKVSPKGKEQRGQRLKRPIRFDNSPIFLRFLKRNSNRLLKTTAQKFWIFRYFILCDAPNHSIAKSTAYSVLEFQIKSLLSKFHQRLWHYFKGYLWVPFFMHNICIRTKGRSFEECCGRRVDCWTKKGLV